MKKILSISIIGLTLVLCGCSTTTITTTDYAADGTTITKVTTTEQSGNPFVILAENSAQKSWAIRQGGWRFNVGYDPTTNAVGINGGSIDNMLSSFTDSVLCDKCFVHCPTVAIQMVVKNPKDNKSPKIPAIDETCCIGCGACENLCLARSLAAICGEVDSVHSQI